MKTGKTICMLLSLAMVLSLFCSMGIMPGASAAEADAALTVDLRPSANTGEIIHGAAGFLYGVSSDDVPTTNTIVPLKSKILCTKGAVGTEHPYGDALDVAKTFLESGGQQVMMYNSNYYGVFGVTASIERYCEDLRRYICPAVVAWKAAWKEEHGTPDAPKDGTGKVVDIDKAICYIPINEGTPAGNNFYQAWESYYNAIKSVDQKAYVVGPNSSHYDNCFTYGQNLNGFIQHCANNNCMPDIITWHELNTSDLRDMHTHMNTFRSLWNNINWTTYNNTHGTTGIPEIPQICFNEYAEMAECGVPGRLVNWISRLEDEKVTACLPFWHQANNLNDLAAGANEGNGAWWLYQWYGNMSGTTQPVSTTTEFSALYGVSTMDEAKKLSTTLLGGFTGDIAVKLNHVSDTATFADAEYVNVTVQETTYTGFHGVAQSTPTIIRGVYPVEADGSVTVMIPGALFENAYNVTMTRASETDLAAAGMVLIGSSGDVYEAESAATSNGASAARPNTSPSYHMSSDRAVNMPTNGTLTYTINVPRDGKYKLEFLYGNGQGTVRNDMNTHDPVNAVQTFALDHGEAVPVTMESTLFQTMCGMKTLYYDLTAGRHTIRITTTSRISSNMLYHDCLRVAYAGVYGEAVPAFNTVYEAELADFNKLLGNADSTVTTQSDIIGYSGGGYVKGLSARRVPEGGGIRYTIVVGDSGLYNLTLQYASNEAGTANIYVGNTATVLDRVNKTMALPAGELWQSATASVYLQKGINVVDVDATVDIALDYLRVRALASQEHAAAIEAEDAIPAAMADKIRVAESDGASGGKYVVGMKGAYADANYLELHYNAPAAGKYQLQVFHSNEDLAGSHSYNIKTTDKYAVFEVNGVSNSPAFTVLDHGDSNKDANATPEDLLYFADCGDHDPTTVSKGESLGILNSVTDRLYGRDASGYRWGVVMEDPREVETPHVGGGGTRSSDNAVYTNFQKALSNSDEECQDGRAKTATCRYSHNQDASGIEPRYVSYRFELDPAKYDVVVCMGNTWNNAGNPTVTVSAAGCRSVSAAYSVGANANVEKTMRMDLTEAETNAEGKVELSVRASSTDPTIQMNYIIIKKGSNAAEAPEGIVLPGGAIVDAENLPEDIYLGSLTRDVPWMLDLRSVKDDSDRYFFINTFSDDTFREKTITLDLVEGDNTIKIYNDNSWNVTYGGTTALPATVWVDNYAPNFDKFIITPMALDVPVAQEEAFNILLTAGQGGTVVADRNAVGANGSYTLTIRPAAENKAKVLINGHDYSGRLAAGENGAYTLRISGVTSDQNISVFFGDFIDAHEYVASVTAPTCTEAGYTTYSCSCGCKDTYIVDVLPALGHDFADGACTRCGEREEIPYVNPFGDVKEGAFYYNAVEWAVKNKITDGVAAGRFAPSHSVTRGQIVTFLWRAAGCPEPKMDASFVDLKAGAFYNKAVAWAVENGITDGVAKNRFAPDSVCTRAQIVTFLWRYMGEPKPSAPAAFSDLKAGAFYVDAVRWAVEAGVTNGITDVLFKPNNPCTRGQAVTFLQRTAAK